MRYFVMESLEGAKLPACPKGEQPEVVKTTDLKRFQHIDYSSQAGLISDRLKLLLEKYMPKYDFVPVVFFDLAANEQLVFWRLFPPLYCGFEAQFRNDGFVQSMVFTEKVYPIIFTAKSPKGVRSVVVRLAVAESILRRDILGVKLTKVCE